MDQKVLTAVLVTAIRHGAQIILGFVVLKNFLTPEQAEQLKALVSGNEAAIATFLIAVWSIVEKAKKKPQPPKEETP